MESEKVYVGYEFYGYDGCSEPICVFRKESDAIWWTEKDPTGDRIYVELEVE